MDGRICGWMDGWMDGWMGVKVNLRIGYSNKKLQDKPHYLSNFDGIAGLP